LVLVYFAGIITACAGLAMRGWAAGSRKMIWGVVAYSMIAVVLNAITPSAGERALWLPVTIIMAGCALVVALRKSKPH
jgi:hypothetical protein